MSDRRVHGRVAGGGVLGVLILAFMALACGAAGAASMFHWSPPVTVDTPAGVDTNPILLRAVSCPASSLCYAADADTNVLSTSDPGGTGAWKAVFLGGVASSGPQAVLDSLSCGGRSLCLAIDSWLGPPDGSDALVVSTDPGGPATAWRGLDPGGPVGLDGFAHFSGLTCTSAKLCALSVSGVLRVSRDPSRGNSWRNGHVKGQRADVYCPPASRCVALRGSCPALTLCVMPNGAGKIAFSLHPSRGLPSWKSRKIPGHYIERVTCPTAKLCVALDDRGSVLISNNPSLRTGAWQVSRPDTAGLTAVSCPSESFCVGVDGLGRRVVGTTS